MAVSFKKLNKFCIRILGGAGAGDGEEARDEEQKVGTARSKEEKAVRETA